MNLDQIISAVDDLSPEERDLLQVYLAQHHSPHQIRTVAAWMAELENIADEFRGNSSDEEMQEISQAMSLKSKPSDKGL